MVSELGGMASHHPRLASRHPHLPALGVLDGPQGGVDVVHLLPVHTAGPDHASIAEIHRLFAPEDAGGGEVTVVLSPPVPAMIWYEHRADILVAYPSDQTPRHFQREV